MDQLSSEITNTPASSTVEDLWDTFKTGLKQSMDKNIPTKVCKNRNNNKKFRSFKSKENIHKKEVGPYRGFGY